MYLTEIMQAQRNEIMQAQRRDKGRCGADAGALCLSSVPVRFPEDKHKAQYISLKKICESDKDDSQAQIDGFYL